MLTLEFEFGIFEFEMFDSKATIKLLMINPAESCRAKKCIPLQKQQCTGGLF